MKGEGGEIDQRAWCILGQRSATGLEAIALGSSYQNPKCRWMGPDVKREPGSSQRGQMAESTLDASASKVAKSKLRKFLLARASDKQEAKS